MPLLVHCIPYPIITTTVITIITVIMTIIKTIVLTMTSMAITIQTVFVRTNVRNFSDYDSVETIFIREVLKFEESFPAVPHAIPSSSVVRSSRGRCVIAFPVFRRAALIFTRLSIVARGY